MAPPLSRRSELAACVPSRPRTGARAGPRSARVGPPRPATRPERDAGSPRALRRDWGRPQGSGELPLLRAVKAVVVPGLHLALAALASLAALKPILAPLEPVLAALEAILALAPPRRGRELPRALPPLARLPPRIASAAAAAATARRTAPSPVSTGSRFARWPTFSIRPGGGGSSSLGSRRLKLSATPRFNTSLRCRPSRRRFLGVAAPRPASPPRRGRRPVRRTRSRGAADPPRRPGAGSARRPFPAGRRPA